MNVLIKGLSFFTIVATASTPLVKLEQDTGVPIFYIASAASSVGSLIASAIIGTGVVCNLTGITYPAYASYKAIKSDDKDDDTQWVTYWVVFAFMTIIETFSEFILEIFPYYYLLKYLFVVWLFSPATFGADIIYKQVVKPFILQHQAQIEQVTSTLDTAVDAGLEATAEITESVKEMVQETVQEMSDANPPASEEIPPSDPPAEVVATEETPAVEEVAPVEDAPPASEEPPAE